MHIPRIIIEVEAPTIFTDEVGYVYVQLGDGPRVPVGSIWWDCDRHGGAAKVKVFVEPKLYEHEEFRELVRRAVRDAYKKAGYERVTVEIYPSA